MVPSSDLENNIDVGNTERNDYESTSVTSQLTVLQIHSAEMDSKEYANSLLYFLCSKLFSFFLIVVFSSDL